MVLINRPDEPHTYIAIATDDVTKITKHHVEQQLGGGDHKPVLLVTKQDLHQAGRKLPKLGQQKSKQATISLKKKSW